MSRCALAVTLVVCALVAGACASGADEAERPASTAPKEAPVEAPTDAPVAPPEPSAAAATPDLVRSCPSYGLDGVVGAPGAGFERISTRNMTCGEAKPIILSLRGLGRSQDMRGFRCVNAGLAGETSSWRCASGDQAFRFTFGT